MPESSKRDGLLRLLVNLPWDGIDHSRPRVWRDRIDGNSESRQFLCCSLREADYACFRCGVRGLTEVSVQPSVRGHVYHSAKLRSTKVGNTCSREAESAAQVHREDSLPLLVGELPEDLVAKDASVVRENVNAARLDNSYLNRSVDSRAVGHVGGNPPCAYRLCGPSNLRLIEVNEVRSGVSRLKEPSELQPDT